MRVVLNHSFTKPLSLLLVIVLTIVTVFPVRPAEAAALTSLSDTMTSQTISATSSHTMRFTTPSGASATSTTIVITFPASYDFTGKATTSVTFTHGPSTGLENAETFAGVPSATSRILPPVQRTQPRQVHTQRQFLEPLVMWVI